MNEDTVVRLLHEMSDDGKDRDMTIIRLVCELRSEVGLLRQQVNETNRKLSEEE